MTKATTKVATIDAKKTIVTTTLVFLNIFLS
jgi:hypothetical protein